MPVARLEPRFWLTWALCVIEVAWQKGEELATVDGQRARVTSSWPKRETGFRYIGSESLRHFKRIYEDALRRIE